MLLIDAPLALARVQAHASRRAEERRRREAQAGRPGTECVICMEVDADGIGMAFVPCGHACCCRACGEKIMASTRRCPMCNAETLLHMRVHSS